MKKLVVWSVIAALVLAALAILDRSCRRPGPDPARWVAREKYEADVKAETGKTAAALAVIAEKAAVIVEKDKDLAARNARIEELKTRAAGAALERDALAKETAVLKADAAAAIAANPAVKRLVDNFELRLAASDRQVLTLTALVEEERASKVDWMVKYEAARIQRDEWKGAYERENALRLGCQSLVADLDRQAPAASFERVASDVEGLGVGVYAALKHKDPIPLALYAGEKLAVKVWGLFHR